MADIVTLYWRGPCAYLNWHQGGQRFRRSLGKLAASEAEKIRTQKEAELVHGVKIISRAPLVRDFFERWYFEHYDATHPTTGGKLRSEVKRFITKFGHRPIDSLKREELNSYTNDRLTKDKASRETVGKEVRRLKAAFNAGIEMEHLEANPMKAIKAPRGVRSVAVKFYDKTALSKLYKANPSRAALWQFMAHTGLRRGEMCKFTKDDVQRGCVMIESIPDETGSGRTKSGKWRPVPLNANAKAALKKLQHKPVTVHFDTLTDWFSADAKKAGIGGTLNRLRHTFGANLTMAGVPLRRVQDLMGHADYKTTEKFYAHLAPEGAGGAVKALEKLL